MKAEERWDGLGGGGGRESVPERLEGMDGIEPVGEMSVVIVGWMPVRIGEEGCQKKR